MCEEGVDRSDSLVTHKTHREGIVDTYLQAVHTYQLRKYASPVHAHLTPRIQDSRS